MKPTTPKNKGGRPADPTITELSTALAVTRRRAAQLLKEGAPTDEIRKLRAEKLTLEIERLQIEIDQRKGSLVSREDMFRTGQKIGTVVSASFARMASNLPGQLAGLGELRICEILRATFDVETEAVNRAVGEI